MNRAFHVYLLRCSDGSYYTGHTENFERRVAPHQGGEVSDFTARRRPVELVWSQSFHRRDEAFACERQIKGWSRAKKEALIRGDWDELQTLSRTASSVRPEPVEGRSGGRGQQGAR